MKRYLVNEIFHSLQGEGCNAGIPMTFVRFAKCNLACSKTTEGFDCDTDFARGEWYDTGELASAILAHRWTEWLLFTGGEPALQLDADLVELTHVMGYKIAIETNGTRLLPEAIDWVCVSPKPGHPVVITEADEFKFVVPAGGSLPDITGLRSKHFLLSPAADGEVISPAALATCIDLVKTNPGWRLSYQQHKTWGIR